MLDGFPDPVLIDVFTISDLSYLGGNLVRSMSKFLGNVYAMRGVVLKGDVVLRSFLYSPWGSSEVMAWLHNGLYGRACPAQGIHGWIYFLGSAKAIVRSVLYGKH